MTDWHLCEEESVDSDSHRRPRWNGSGTLNDVTAYTECMTAILVPVNLSLDASVVRAPQVYRAARVARPANSKMSGKKNQKEELSE